MPIVLSDKDALSIWAQLEVLRNVYESKPQSQYRDFELAIVRRHLAQLSSPPKDRRDIIRAVK